jgi:hypothetical protein
MSEENPESIAVSVSVVQSELERVLSQGVRTNSDNIFHEPMCTICSSPHRKAMEERWKTRGCSCEDIHDLLEGRTDANFSDDVIKNHMNWHKDKGAKEEVKKEYINRIKRYSDHELTTLDSIKFAMATIMDRIVEINSITPGGDYSATDIDKIKSGELSKLVNMWGKFTKMKSDFMGEMKDTGELISIPKQEFVQFFNKALTEAKNDNDKEIVNHILTQLASLSQA